MATYKVSTPKGSAGGSALGLGMGILAGAKPMNKSAPAPKAQYAPVGRKTIDKVNAALDQRGTARKKQEAMAKARKK